MNIVRIANMVDGMQVTGAARAPPHFLSAVPTTECLQFTATLGTTTARTELLDRRARRAFHPSHSKWSRGFHLILLTLFSGAFMGSPGPCRARVIADARPFLARRPSPPPHPPAPFLHPYLHRSPRALLALPSAADGCPIFLLSTWSPPGLIIPSPPAPRGPALSAWTSSYTTTSASPPTTLAPLFSAPPVHSRRKAMAPAYPDARKGSCQNGLSFNRSHPMLAKCPPSVTRLSTYRPYTASQMCFLLTTRAPHFTDQPSDQPPHRARPSEVRAAEHRDAGGRTLQRPQRGTQAVGPYHRAWCAPTNQSPNPITSLISHYPTLTPVTRITTPTLRPPTRRGHGAARNPTHAPRTQLTHPSINP